MASLNDIELKGKKVLMRVDFNVPLNDRLEVTDNTRIVAALPSIKTVLDKGGGLVLMSHLGRPKGQKVDNLSLRPVAGELDNLLKQPVRFIDECVGERAEKAVKELKSGEVLLLENLRFHPEEKLGDEDFSKNLAGLGADIYVNDAFGAAHRKHASTAVIASYFPKSSCLPGLLMQKEVEMAAAVYHQFKRPFTVILGGAKVSDKILLIDNLLQKADQVIIGGAMAFTFAKAKGGDCGSSLVEDDKLDVAETLMQKAAQNGVELILPTDQLIAQKIENNASTQISDIDQIPEDRMGLDIGPETRALFHQAIMKSKTILWNGPMGVFEIPTFSEGTRAIADSVAESTKGGAFSLIGGGDTVAAVKDFELEDSFSFLSTGGGALLSYFEGKQLPALTALDLQ